MLDGLDEIPSYSARAMDSVIMAGRLPTPSPSVRLRLNSGSDRRHARGGKRKRVRLTAKMRRALLWREGQPQPAIRMEELLERTWAGAPVLPICADVMGTFFQEAHAMSSRHLPGALSRVRREAYSTGRPEERPARDQSAAARRARDLETRAQASATSWKRPLRYAREQAGAASKAKASSSDMLGHEAFGNPSLQSHRAELMKQMRGDGRIRREDGDVSDRNGRGHLIGWSTTG